MLYHDREQAMLECRLNARKIGGKWEPVLVEREIAHMRGYLVTEQVWQPQRVRDDGHARRTQFWNN